MGVHTIPFDVAANGIGERSRNRPARQNVVECVLQIVDRHLVGLARVVDAAPGVDQLAVGVEDEGVRCGGWGSGVGRRFSGTVVLR